jgi:proton-dependent oligopeptide transporter, POT family
MALGVVQYVLGAKYLGDAGMEPAPAASPEAGRQLRSRATLWGIVGLVALIGFALASYTGAVAVTPSQVADAAGYFLLIVTLAFFGWLFLSGDWTPEERKRLYAIGVLFLAAALFWSVFEQAGSTLNLFADRNTRTELLGLPFPSSWFQSLNSLYIITLAPVFAWLWVRLGSREPSSPAKFGVGLLFVGAGFGILVIAARLAEQGIQVSPMWLAMTYLLHTIGELSLSPVGLSAMTKLAPARIAGLMMGVWFLATSVGNFIAGRLAGFYEAMPLPDLFGTVTAFAMVAGVIMLLLVRPIKRLMGGVN